VSATIMQESILEELLRDDRPVDEWIRNATTLVGRVYEHDAALARQLEVLLQQLDSTASNLDCIGTDDPTAPPNGASTREVLPYLFRRYDELHRDYRRIFARVDQIVGRNVVRDCVRTGGVEINPRSRDTPGTQKRRQ
jgi:hypothetical protein